MHVLRSALVTFSVNTRNALLPQIVRPNAGFLILPVRQNSTTNSTAEPSFATAKWDLLSAVCLERKPVITPQLTPLEREMTDIMARLEFIQSLKSDHEKRQDEEMKRAKQLKESGLEETDPDLATKQTSQDFEDACNEEYANFKPAPRITAADESGDLKSTDRLLDRHLLFVVKSSTGKNNWILPQAEWKAGESLKQTAERALSQHVSGVQTKFLGNAPWGVHTIKYPQSVRQKKGVLGVKVFFFKAQMTGGKCAVNKTVEHNWLGRKELEQFLDAQYFQSVRPFLIDED